MAREVAEAEARRFGRAAGLLSIGVGSAGLLTYVYFSLASHNLSPVDYGEVVVLWSAVFITISTLFRPVEQLLSRTIAERQATEQPIGRPLRVAAMIQLGLAAAFAICALALRGPLQDQLLSGDETLYWILVAAVLAFGASFFARGFLAGSRRFTLYALLLLAESTARVSFALAVAIGIADGQTAVAMGIVAAPLVSLTVVPLAFAHRAAARSGAAPPRASGQPDFTLAAGGGFAAAVLLIMVSEQTLLNAGPLLVRASEGAAAAGFIFNVLMVARAPLVLFQAVATSLLPHLTRLRSSADSHDAEAFRLSIRLTIGAVAVFAAAVALVVLIAGPELMQLAFGKNFDYDRLGTSDRHRRHGLLSRRGDPEPGGLGAGAGPPRRRLLGRVRTRLRRLEPVAGAGRVPSRRGWIRRRGGATPRAPLPPLPPPAGSPGGCRRARLTARARGATGGRRRSRLTSTGDSSLDTIPGSLGVAGLGLLPDPAGTSASTATSSLARFGVCRCGDPPVRLRRVRVAEHG